SCSAGVLARAARKEELRNGDRYAARARSWIDQSEIPAQCRGNDSCLLLFRYRIAGLDGAARRCVEIWSSPARRANEGIQERAVHQQPATLLFVRRFHASLRGGFRAKRAIDNVPTSRKCCLCFRAGRRGRSAGHPAFVSSLRSHSGALLFEPERGSECSPRAPVDVAPVARTTADAAAQRDAARSARRISDARDG